MIPDSLCLQQRAEERERGNNALSNGFSRVRYLNSLFMILETFYILGKWNYVEREHEKNDNIFFYF